MAHGRRKTMWTLIRMADMSSLCSICRSAHHTIYLPRWTWPWLNMNSAGEHSIGDFHQWRQTACASVRTADTVPVTLRRLRSRQCPFDVDERTPAGRFSLTTTPKPLRRVHFATEWKMHRTLLPGEPASFLLHAVISS